MKHIIIAAKGEKTPHDVAELTLMTVEEYRRTAPHGAPVPTRINHVGDAREISTFLRNHLPAETFDFVCGLIKNDRLSMHEATTTTAGKLGHIQHLLEQAHAVFVSMPTHVQDRITEIHNNEGSLIHCLNFGIQAAQEAIERVNTYGDELDSSPRP